MDQFVMELFWSSLTSSESESSTDDSEVEEDMLQPLPQKIVKISEYVEKVTRSYTEKVFQSHFRMARATMYRILIHRFENSDFTPKNLYGKEKVSNEKSILMVVWYLSNNETFRQVSDRFDVSLSSAHRILQRVLKFIISLKKDYFKWPTNEEAAVISSQFRSKKSIDNIIGAIDGCHVQIKRPMQHEEAYVNRKEVHSLLLQGIVNARKCFIDVYCGEPGSIHDARLLRKSNIYRRGQLEPEFFGNKFLLGDSAYPSLQWLVPPFKDTGRLTEHQRIFNYRHSATRIVIEHSFGLLKGRFRRLHILENSDLKTAANIILACCVLHNICQIEKDPSHIEPYNITDDISDVPEALDYYMAVNSKREQVFRLMFPEE